MKFLTPTSRFSIKAAIVAASCLVGALQSAHAAVTLEAEVQISDSGLHFDGKKITHGTINQADTTTEKFDYFFGPNISAHGDAVKSYKNFVFTTWYRGGKNDRHVMLSRYNTETGVVKTIEFPHQHTGFNGNRYIGESHNTIAVSISPINGTIHMLYDMHAYSPTKPTDGSFANDYFRYSYSVAGAAEVSDDEFTLGQFVKDTSSVSEGPDDYKHLTMTGNLADKGNFARLTYPTFFTNTDGTLLLYMRKGGNNNGGYVFNRYDAASQTWSKFTEFNKVNAKSFGNDYNWGLYGHMKYVNGKLRVGFQQRSSDNNDKYRYQNGVYYAYSDHPEGFGDWKNHRGESMTFPLVNSDEIKVFEPGDFISHTEANSVYIVGSFDWTVTQRGDVHMISKVRSTDRNRPDYQEVYIHSYKPVGAADFTHSTDFGGASNIYTAGDNIYIIGLDNGRPFVERALGGTNDFERVYEATEGKSFHHGVVHIKGSKLYYYLMENDSGTERPLYLQIIDLDIDAEPPVIQPKPQVSFPQPVVTVTEGYESLSFRVNATSPDPNRELLGVELFANDQFIREDTAAPYVWGHKNKPTELLGLPVGQNIFRAVATDNLGLQGSNTMILNVIPAAKPTVAFRSSSFEAYEGYPQMSFTVDAAAAHSTVPLTGVKLYANGRFIREDTAAPFVWGHRNKPTELLGLPVGTNTLTVVVTDTAGQEAQASVPFEVKPLPLPSVSFDQSYLTATAGYESLAVGVNAGHEVDYVNIDSVALYLDGVLVREQLEAPYLWGDDQFPAELTGLPVGVYMLTAVATDSFGGQAETSMILEVTPKIIYLDVEDGAYPASNMFDGDTTDESRWSPEQPGKRVIIDLGETMTITGIKLWTYLDQKHRYQVYVGDFPDRSFKKVINDMKRSKSQDLVAQPVMEELNERARYVKVMLHSLSDGSKDNIGLTELQVLTERD